MIGGICCLTSDLFSLWLMHRLTGPVQIPFGDIDQFDDKIATNMSNEKNDKERQNVAIEDDKQEMKDKIRDLENEKVPSYVKELQNITLHVWETKLKKMVQTKATEYIYEKVKIRNVVVIAGPTGSGKSAIAYHTALRLKEESGYSILPARQSVDITNYYIAGRKQIFIIDDFIGKYTVDETDLGSWEKNWPLLNVIFSNGDDTKLILTSRTYIWQQELNACSFLGAYTCDLLSDQIKLSPTERWNICDAYLNKVDITALKNDTLLMYSFFPSLCYSYNSSENISVEDFFTAPYQMIENEIDHFKTKSQVSYIALALLAIKPTISKNSFSIDNHKYDVLFDDVFHESAFHQYPSKNLLKSTLVALTGTYVVESKNYFMLSHEILQNIIRRCIAKTLMKSVLKYCKTELILKQIRLASIYEKRDIFTIEVATDNEDAYFRRLVDELGKGWNKVIFENEQNKNHEFRDKFIKFMKKKIPCDNWEKMQNGLPHIHVVSSLGYQDYVSFFLQGNTIINQKDSDGNTPLHLACAKGQTQVVEYLIEKNASTDIANNQGLKPFFYACENEAIQIAKYLLHHCAKCINVDEKYRTRNNGSVLHIVSEKGFTHIAVLLLEKKANANVLDGSGCTPLHVASIKGNSAVVKALLGFNANVDAVDLLGRSPVYLACSYNQERVLHLLIDKNAAINQKTINGFRPLHVACQSGNVEIVKALLEKNAQINSSKPGVTPLHLACTSGNASIINTLIAAKASVNHKTKDGLTPLHEACKKGHIEVVQILLDNKANVNQADTHAWTALFFSCSEGSHTIVNVLVQRGAYVNICDEDKVTPLMIACKENRVDVVNSLLLLHSNVNCCDKDNCSSLSFACKTGNEDVVNLLLTYSADIHLADKYQITPLHTACMNRHTNVVLILIEHKADVNAKDNLRQTPLFKSSLNGYIDIVEILLNHGASVNICDNAGLSPIAIAEIKGHKTVVDVLRQFRPNNKIV